MLLHLLSVVLLVGTVLATPGSDSWSQDTLKAHNAYRANHGSSPLVYDDTVAAWAQEWANNLLKIGKLQHRSNNKYGENLYWSSTTTATGKDATKAWYDEIKDYKNYDVDPFSKNSGVNFSAIGHFTQVVWKGSKALGCGSASARGKGTYIVCNYDPPGNYVGQFPANVRPPLS